MKQTRQFGRFAVIVWRVFAGSIASGVPQTVSEVIMRLFTLCAGRKPAFSVTAVLTYLLGFASTGCVGQDASINGTGSISVGGQTSTSNGQGSAQGGTSSGGDSASAGTAGGEVELANATLQMSTQGPRPWRTFRETLGVGTKFAQGQSQADLSLVADLGVRWVRDYVDWNIMEPEAGQYIDFPAAFQSRLDFYRTNGIGVVFLLAYDAWTAYAPTDSNPAAAFDPVAFGKYAVEAAKRLESAGVRYVLEMWNEPHNMVLRPTLGGNWNGAPPSPWVDHYLRMVDEAVTRVKAYDPDAQLLTDDDMWILHYWFLEAGLPSALDGFAFHPYVKGNPERAAVDQNTDWMSPFVGVDPDGSFTSAVRRLRTQGEQKLAKTPGMWITEWGWPVGQADETSSGLSEDTVAAWLPRAFVLAETSAAETMCWFSIQDSVDGPMGLTMNDGTKRKAYYAFKTLSASLGDYYYLGQVAGTNNATSGTQAHLFRLDSSAKLVAWNIEPTLAWLRLDGQLKQAKVTDIYGSAVTASIGSTGASYVPLGPAPIYLEFQAQNRAPTLRVVNRTGNTPP